jgi:hypothetical protein
MYMYVTNFSRNKYRLIKMCIAIVHELSLALLLIFLAFQWF